ncbi:glycosyl hydrolase 108 family protein [Flectobacillus sp. DC10W]|uniref:Glycosyl hydrolase 108 family protein n=1 Tax=Flectobacillus longus TaxID=2984207 RepID=A0ABT6YK94_9BACT|nr:glycosyl hydrolase 108 family protein [Flectobacillus longus]MDI9863965.1 glycosyl hydrolase 108 family protein [Flectobacillus longus]
MKGKILVLIVFLIFCPKILNAAKLDLYFPHLMKSEGLLFVVIQWDRGNETKFGVTLVTYKIACARMIAVSCDKNRDGVVSAHDLALTTQQDVKPIYRVMYWEQARADEIKNQAIAEQIVDILVNMGAGKGRQHIKAIQKFVGAQSDGIIGSGTIRKINATNQKILYNSIVKYRLNYYKAIGVGNQKKFLRGWLNRVHNLKAIHKNEKYL